MLVLEVIWLQRLPEIPVQSLPRQSEIQHKQLCLVLLSSGHISFHRSLFQQVSGFDQVFEHNQTLKPIYRSIITARNVERKCMHPSVPSSFHPLPPSPPRCFHSHLPPLIHLHVRSTVHPLFHSFVQQYYLRRHFIYILYFIYSIYFISIYKIYV